MHSAKLRQDCGVSTDYSGYTSRPELKLHGVPNLDSAYDKLNVKWALRLADKLPSDTSDDLKRDLWSDLSQNPHRGAKFSGGTICTSSVMYSFEKDCVLDGEDCWRLQGWPADFATSPEFSSAEKKSLAAEGFHLPSIAVIFAAVYFNPYASWWKTTTSQAGP